LRKVTNVSVLMLTVVVFDIWLAGLLAAADFNTFYLAFKAAVARNDAKAVAGMTQLPFLFDGRPRNSFGFQKIYPQLFDANVRTCFAKAKPVIEQDAQVVNCGRYIFYFRVMKDRYRFIEFAADPEAVQ
jgi:hypothetical protein